MESRGRRRPEVPGVPPPVMGKTQGAGTLLQAARPSGEGPAPCLPPAGAQKGLLGSMSGEAEGVVNTGRMEMVPDSPGPGAGGVSTPQREPPKHRPVTPLATATARARLVLRGQALGRPWPRTFHLTQCPPTPGARDAALGSDVLPGSPSRATHTRVGPRPESEQSGHGLSCP